MIHEIACGSGVFQVGFHAEKWWFAHYIGRDQDPSWADQCDSLPELIAMTSGEIDWRKVNPAIIVELRSHHDRAFLDALGLVAHVA